MTRQDELRKMVAEATPGQWYVSDDWNVSAPGKTVLQGALDVVSDAESEANAALAAQAPTLATDLAAALDAVEALRAEVARLREALHAIAGYNEMPGVEWRARHPALATKFDTSRKAKLGAGHALSVYARATLTGGQQ